MKVACLLSLCTSSFAKEIFQKALRIPLQSGKSLNSKQNLPEIYNYVINCKKLLRWKESDYRKPLILEGVRQVGKTWILKEFGRLCYENTAYFNFRANPELKEFFRTTKDPARILPNLMLASAQRIEPEKTLIFFDEIETAPDVIASLKYFCEEAPPLPRRLCFPLIANPAASPCLLSCWQSQFP